VREEEGGRAAEEEEQDVSEGSKRGGINSKTSMDFDTVLHGEKAGEFMAMWTICSSCEDMCFLQQEGRVNVLGSA
jgi:hypothetical protein